MKNTATPFVIPARNLYSQIFTFGKKNEKFHTMMRKSSMLKLCQQPAMNLSTSYKHFKNTHGAKQEDNENKSDNVVRKSKEEICRNICADLEETSKRRHSYKELHASGKMSESNDMDKKLKKSSTTIQSAENLKTLKDTKTTAEQLEAPSTDLESPKQSEDSSTAIHSPEKVKGSSMTVVVQSSEVKIPSNTTPTDSPFIEKQSTKTEVLKNTSTNIHLPEKLESSSIAMKSTKKTDSSSNLIREKRSEEEKDERRELEETERTKNSGMPLNERLTSVQNMKMRKSQSDGPDFHGQPKMRIFGHQELPRRMQYRAPQNVRVTLSPPNPPQQMNRTDPSPSQYTRPNFRDVPNQKSPLSSYRQPHKVPFAYRPEDIRYAEKLKSAQLRPRDKNPHPSLMLENRYVRYIEVPYKPPNESMRRMTQRLRKQRLSYESQNIKEINGKAMGNILADVRDATTINTNDVMQESRSTMSKLVENHSVVIEGPSKLKLVTLPQPQLRHETDVIIKMEYVTLTDADRRHFLSGKYNPYSYSTMSVGRTGCGKVIETGPKVSNVKLGDKVLVKQ
ncbi:Zinc-type alcohol dehydrogenase-like protein, partial [Pseudolycoriella hygida]